MFILTYVILQISRREIFPWRIWYWPRERRETNSKREIGPLLCVVASPRSSLSTGGRNIKHPYGSSCPILLLPRCLTKTFLSGKYTRLSSAIRIIYAHFSVIRDGMIKMYDPKTRRNIVIRVTGFSECEFRGTRVSYKGTAPETRAGLHEPRKTQ